MNEALDILVFGAHADDAEIGMGGTLIKHIRAGKRVGVCDLTRAEMSSNGTVETRQKEAEEAGRRLGLSYRSNLGLPDRGLQNNPEQVTAIVNEIRKLKPKIVFAPFWKDRHPDHVMASQLVQEAVFNAKLRNFAQESEAFTVKQLYYYFINDTIDPDLMVDITTEHEAKMHTLEAYQSQFMLNAQVDTVITPLNQGYLERVEARDRLLGQKQSMAFAEGFMSKLPYVVSLFQ